jgi:hypothetical protein
MERIQVVERFLNHVDYEMMAELKKQKIIKNKKTKDLCSRITIVFFANVTS